MTLAPDATPSPPPAEPVFHLPAGLHYSCTRDGTCCHGWDIRVEDDEAGRILALDWRSCSLLGPGEKSPFEISRIDGERILRRIGPACNFLGKPEMVCRLHAAHGADVKPRICLRFPYRFVEAPDGVYVGLSFVCRSVLANTGRSAEENRGEIRDQFSRWASAHRLADPVRFDARTPISWADYQIIEQALDEILAREDRPVGDCLIAGHVWLGILRRMLQAISRGPAENVSKAIRFYVERGRADGFARAFDVARKPVAVRVLKRMLLGSFISFRTSLMERRPRLVVAATVVLQNARHWFRLGSLRLPPFEQRFSYRNFRAEAAGLETPRMQELLRRYFRHALFRKDIVRHTDLFWGFCYLVLTYGLIQWYAAALAAAGEADPTEAVGMVERYFVHHSNFDQLFLYHPALAQTVQYLFRKPNFAHTMVNG